MSNFWIVSELFYPNETSTAFYMTEIAKKLANNHRVNVICSKALYEKDTKMLNSTDLLPENINIIKLPAIPLNKNFLISRAINMTLMAFMMAIVMLINIKRKDKVWVVTNPILFLPFSSLISKLKKFNYTIIVHDVFPENLVSGRIIRKNGFLYFCLKYIFDYAFSCANNLVVCGRDMKSLMQSKLKNKNVKIELIENWADIDIIKSVINPSLKKKVYNSVILPEESIIIQFAGNLGRLQGVLEMIQIFKKVENKSVQFIIIGEGALKNEILSEIEFCKNIHYLPSFQRSLQNEFLSACDIGLVSLKGEFSGVGVPSKSYNILAANKPILYIGGHNTEISLMIKESNTGWTFDFHEEKQILEFLNSLDKNKFQNINARKLAESKYSKELILNKYLRLFEN